MTAAERPSRENVVAILAAYGNCPAESIPERIDSLGVAWLVHEAERRFGIVLELDDDLLARMSVVTGAVEVLSAARPRVAHADG